MGRPDDGRSPSVPTPDPPHRRGLFRVSYGSGVRPARLTAFFCNGDLGRTIRRRGDLAGGVPAGAGRSRRTCAVGGGGGFVFFFKGEDGIRDKLVTGVQTCALPI